MQTTRLAPFIDNHDQKRFAGLIGDMALAKNAITFTMLLDGMPVAYQGLEQHFSGGIDPDNRHELWTSGYRTDAELYVWLTLLNQIRALAIRQDPAYVPFQASPIWSDDHTFAMKKAQVVSVVTNLGTGPASYNISLPFGSTGYKPGQELVDLAAPGCMRYTVTSNGTLRFEMTSAPKVFYPAAKLNGNDLCCKTGAPATVSGSVAVTVPRVPRAAPVGVLVDFSVGSDTGLVPRSKKEEVRADQSSVCYVTFNQTRTTNFGDSVKM